MFRGTTAVTLNSTGFLEFCRTEKPEEIFGLAPGFIKTSTLSVAVMELYR